MRRLLCSSVNAKLCLVRQNTRYEEVGNSAKHRVNSILKGNEKPDLTEKVLVYDMGHFQIIEYIFFGNKPVSFLWIKRERDGKMLDLLQLLLGNYIFLPQILSNIETSHIAIAWREKLLEGYDCHIGNEFCNRFYTNHTNSNGAGVIVYKDITIPGNMFSMMHEIVHVWQAMIWPHETQTISCIKLAVDNMDFNNNSLNNIIEFNDVLSKYSSKISLVHYSDCTLGNDVQNALSENAILSLKNNNFFFQSETDVMSKLLQHYIWREKHAWIIAKQLLKQISRGFVDIEPNLNTNDLEQYAQNYLQTHLSSLNKMLKHDWRTVE